MRLSLEVFVTTLSQMHTWLQCATSAWTFFIESKVDQAIKSYMHLNESSAVVECDFIESRWMITHGLMSRRGTAGVRRAGLIVF